MPRTPDNSGRVTHVGCNRHKAGAHAFGQSIGKALPVGGARNHQVGGCIDTFDVVPDAERAHIWGTTKGFGPRTDHKTRYVWQFLHCREKSRVILHWIDPRDVNRNSLIA